MQNAFKENQISTLSGPANSPDFKSIGKVLQYYEKKTFESPKTLWRPLAAFFSMRNLDQNLLDKLILIMSNRCMVIANNTTILNVP